ncbi:hypothetical protein PRUPE_6G171200 [Prunus persica]|uniref:Prolamin-like domain-containing protein n=1 Tax=Prunus persica TaxID=3760 RepID=M5W347_PRUPE|nr:hypothetical protein PRUPE_6G171200 [Prunus persica]
MATFTGYQTSAIWIFVIATMMILPGLATLAPAPSNLKFLEECKSKLHDGCGKEIVDTIMKKWSISDGCCAELVLMGESCHIALVNKALSGPLAKLNKTVAFTKSAEIWTQCFNKRKGLLVKTRSTPKTTEKHPFVKEFPSPL